MKPVTLLSLLSISGVSIDAKTTLAQAYVPTDRVPIADNTLGTKVSGSGNNFDITGGLNRGQTLFHSFTDFSIPTNGSANFINIPVTRDIITRVTGSNYSDLNGKLNSNGANFLLINPNGVVFGPNARLNVGKAFAASTANGVDLVDANGGKYTFGTSANGDAPLLSIDPNVMLNISRLNLGANLPRSSGIVNYGTLQTTNLGQYIGLIGGNVTLNGGKVIAPGGRIELGGSIDFGSISWGEENSFPKLTFPAGVTRSTITLTDGANISVAGSGGGSIAITAQNANLFNGSQIEAGILQSAADRQAGDIVIDVAGNLELSRGKSSFIKNDVATNSVGHAGNIMIKTQVLNMSNGSEVSSKTRGNGNGGNISIGADEINLFEDFDRGNYAKTYTDVIANPTAGARQGGNISIDTRKLKLNNNAHIAAEIRGAGKGGDLTIKVANFEATGGGYISTNTFGGNGGNLTIVTDNLLTLEGPSGITASAYSTGKAGDLTITTDTLQMKRASYLSTGTAGKGAAGNLTVIANKSVNLDGWSKIFAVTFSSGNAGNLNIFTDTLQIKNGSQIAANTTFSGSENAGNLTVNAKTVTIDGEFAKPDGSFAPSGLFAQVDPGGRGNGGTLRLKTQKLSVSNGGKVQAATFSKGNGGSVFINADEIDIFNSPGFTPKQPTNINVGVSIDPQNNLDSQGKPIYPEGNAGNLTIDTRRLNVRNGASIGSDTNGKGNGGLLSITATDSVAVVGAGSALNVGVGSSAVGDGGELKVKTPKLVVKDGGTISTSSAGTGVAGKLNINAKTIDLQNRGTIIGETKSGKGGNIELNASDYLLIRDNSSISATAGTAQQGGDGGNIQIITPFIMALPGNNDITANAYTGNGGNVTILGEGLFGIAYREKGRESNSTSDITVSSTFGQSGSANITTPNTDPAKDTAELPTVLTDPSNQLSQVCNASNRENKLVVAGRGGLPSDANDLLTSDVVWQDPRTARPQTSLSRTPIDPPKLPPPAVGLVFDGKGRATLIAAATQAPTTVSGGSCPHQK